VSIEQGPLNRRDEPASDEIRDVKALALVRAMVNAAKCDGQISQAEQQAILDHLADPSPDAIQFLRDEFSKPLDVREFAWSVPLGMEEQVYAISLIAIDLDTRRETEYLQELGHALRLSPESREAIKEQITGAQVAAR
jgi:uncharacterized membrane protein YebE (DUF533 family)